jgi:hypothetical protein
MDPILVDIAQLRTLALPRITLTPGRVIMARVAEAGDGGRGELAIAGGRISATLPPGVRAGDELRLVVKDVSAERLVLQIETPAAAPRENVEEREAAGEAGGRGHRVRCSSCATRRRISDLSGCASRSIRAARSASP